MCAPAPALGAWSSPARVSAPDGAVYSQPDSGRRRRGPGSDGVPAHAGRLAGGGRARPGDDAAVAAGQVESRRRFLSARGGRAPRVAIDDRGDAVVVWVAGRRLVAAARRGPAGTVVARGRDHGRGPGAGSAAGHRPGGTPGSAVERAPRRGLPGAHREPRLAAARLVGTSRPHLHPGPDAAIARRQPFRGHGRLDRRVPGARLPHRPRRLRAARSSCRHREPARPASALSPGGRMLASWSVDLPGGTPVVIVSERTAPSRGWSAPERRGHRRGPARGRSTRAVTPWCPGRSPSRGRRRASRPARAGPAAGGRPRRWWPGGRATAP